jgi:intracellular sulfur oxidation DsrE/DsrF family protein
LARPIRALALLFCLAGAPVFAGEAEVRYLAEIRLHTAAEFHSVLVRAEQLLASGALSSASPVPVTFVLHGPEVRILLRQNYLQNKSTVDLAAALTALGVVDIKACETWMGGEGIRAEELQPFVTTVAYAPAEIKRLVEEDKYLYF